MPGRERAQVLREEKEFKLNAWGFRWLVKRGYLDLFSEFINRAWTGNDSTKVKDTNLRSVFSLRLEEEDKDLFFKRQRYPLILALIKYLFLANKSRVEWKMAGLLLDKGIPTGNPIALGVRRKFGVLRESVLVINGLGKVKDLFAYCQELSSLPPGPRRLKARRGLAFALGRLLARVHAEGIFHSDLHGGNILVGEGLGEARPRLFLIDLHRIKVRSKSRFKDAVKNIAQLAPYFQGVASQTDGVRFLKAYLGDGAAEGIKTYARAIDRLANRVRQDFYLRRHNRCLKENRDFAALTSRQLKGYVRRSYGDKEFEAFLHDLDSLFHRAAVTFLKISSGGVSALVNFVSSQGEKRLYVKAQQPGGLKAFRYLFSRSRPKRAWLAANGLLLRGVATPLPLAYVRKRKGLLSFHDFFVSLAAEEALPIEPYVAQELGPKPMRGLRQARDLFLAELVKPIRRMHDRGVFHSDLKAHNVLIERVRGKPPRIILVDLDGMKFYRSLKANQRARDLARLDASLQHLFSPKERLHFFHLYKQNCPALKVNARAVLKEAARLSRKKVLQKAQDFASHGSVAG